MLLKSILKELNVLIIFKVKSEGLICVAVSPKMSFFIIPSSLIISSIYLESDLAIRQEL